MARSSYFDSPFLLGFEPLERLLERTAKSAGESYPPYNIEETKDGGLAITLAVAGFALTFVLPEPAGLSLDQIAAGQQNTAEDRQLAGQAPPA